MHPVNCPVDPQALAELRECEAPGGGALLPLLIAQFLSDLDPRLDALRKAVSTGDAAGMRRIAHALTGSCGIFGAKRMMQLCDHLQRSSEEIYAEDVEVIEELELEAKRVRFALLAQQDGAER